jgi:hypothetical protein
LDSLKWPIVVGGVAIYFRKELKQILNRDLSVKHGSTEFTFPQSAQNPSEDKNKEEITKVVNDKTDEEIQGLLKDSQDKDAQIFKFKIEKHFEYTYRIIFRSQIILLSGLRAISDGFSMIQIISHLNNAKKAFPILKDSREELYLKFLFDQNLIEKYLVTSKVRLTNIGDLFLQYIALNQYDYETEKCL